jgi:hypothetical protein
VSTIPLDASWPVDMPATLQRSEDIYSLFTMTFTLGEAAASSASKLNISDRSGPLVTSFSLQSMRDTGGSLRLFAALSNLNQVCFNDATLHNYNYFTHLMHCS